jgi:hypothetical protein
MKQILLALLILLFIAQISVSVYSQSKSSTLSASRLARTVELFSPPNTETKRSDDLVLAARTISALKRLDNEVLVYRSLGDFETNGRLARVPFEAFANDLQEVTTEVEPLLSRLPQSKLKIEIRNALDSYRDGAFWWQKIDQPRVVNVSALASTEITRTPSDTALLGTVPYTVAIHWRQAGKYLKHAEEMMNGTRK